MEKIFQEALGVDSPWYVKKVEITEKSNRIDIYVDFKRGTKFTNENDGTLCKVHDTVKRTYRHLDFLQYECYLNVRVPRIKKKDGKVKLIYPPWVGMISIFTIAFEKSLLQLCKLSPIHQVSQTMGISDYLLWKVLDLYVSKALANEDLSKIDTLGIYETSVIETRSYTTIFFDLKKKRTVHISTGNDSQAIDDFIRLLKSKGGNPKQINNISCSMSADFVKYLTKKLPNAKIIFDESGVLKTLNKQIEKVHDERALDDLLSKKNSYGFSKNGKNLITEYQTDKGKKKLQEQLSLSKFNLDSIGDVYNTETLQYLDSLDNLADLEKQLNSFFQELKKRAKGLTPKSFRTIVYLLTGKLDFERVSKSVLPLKA